MAASSWLTRIAAGRPEVYRVAHRQHKSADKMKMPDPAGAARVRFIRLWIGCLAALVFAMVVVGGATRLTQSGLSIVEWKPVTGVIPPLSQADWQVEFEKYKTIPQYERVNRGMSLAEFKTIFWWEWSHRLLGRLIGAAFALPFLWFLWRGFIDRGLAVALAGIFMLGAVQGAVGWWMVASGLTERVSVSQYRLAFHLTLACLIYAALVRTADRVAMGAPAATPRRIALGATSLLVLVLVQIYLGALVAGLHAGLIYNTWPLIDGGLVPKASNLLFDRLAWRNFFENPLTVQFDHRMVAYALVALALLHLGDVFRNVENRRLRTGAALLAVAVCAQAAIGIITLVASAPIGLAMLHQAMALVVLTVATLHASRATIVPVSAPVGRLASRY
jgi:cytochrome c oxidase assembly protein subunit 15